MACRLLGTTAASLAARKLFDLRSPSPVLLIAPDGDLVREVEVVLGRMRQFAMLRRGGGRSLVVSSRGDSNGLSLPAARHPAIVARTSGGLAADVSHTARRSGPRALLLSDDGVE